MVMPGRPATASIAAEPVSPLVAPTMVSLSVAREATNNGQIDAQNISALVQQYIINAGSVTADLELGLKSATSYIANSGVLRGRDVVISS